MLFRSVTAKSLLKSFNRATSEDSKKSILEKLRKIMDNASLNEGQEPEMNYYKKLMCLIRIEQIDSLHLSEVEEVYDFLELDKSTLSKKLNKRN